jgi:CubicO group peptidase (beta-lactamase class C family)
MYGGKAAVTLFALLPVFCLVLPAIARAQSGQSIRRLDGSKISLQDADAFAGKTLKDAHVTGAQIAVLNNGRLMWSAAFGLRRRDPALPMDRETTTWAASITKSVFATYVMQLVERKHSGEGINLVQFVVEQKMHKPLDQLMQDAIFTPLGMTRTGIIYRGEFEADVADRYDLNEKFRSQTKRFPARAAGSMTTSAGDLAKFTTALLDGKIISNSTRAEMLRPVLRIDTLHEFAIRANEGKGKEARDVGLSYGVGWGLLTHTRYGPAFFKEGHGDGAQNYMICFERSKSCMILLTNSDNGELAFRPLLEKILGDTVTPFEWEGYTPEYIEQSRKNDH